MSEERILLPPQVASLVNNIRACSQLGSSPFHSTREESARPFVGADALSRREMFVCTVSAHARGAYPEPELAQDLGLSIRQLSRLSRKWFGHSPRVIHAVLRVSLLAEALRLGEKGLRVLACEFGYPSRQCMNRHFRRFMGVTPFQYRLTIGRSPGNGPVTTMSEFDLFRESSTRGIPTSSGRVDTCRSGGTQESNAPAANLPSRKGS